MLFFFLGCINLCESDKVTHYLLHDFSYIEANGDESLGFNLDQSIGDENEENGCFHTECSPSDSVPEKFCTQTASQTLFAPP